MYTHTNYKNKKALKDAVSRGERVTYFQPNDMGLQRLPTDGIVWIEGPHAPKPHTWYAKCEVKGGVIVKVS